MMAVLLEKYILILVGHMLAFQKKRWIKGNGRFEKEIKFIYWYKELFVVRNNDYLIAICDVLHDLVPFVQFKKSEKHPRRSATFNKVASFYLELAHESGNCILLQTGL